MCAGGNDDGSLLFYKRYSLNTSIDTTEQNIEVPPTHGKGVFGIW